MVVDDVVVNDVVVLVVDVVVKAVGGGCYCM